MTRALNLGINDERKDNMGDNAGMPMAGPERLRLTPEQKAERKSVALAAVWRAINEASQYVPLRELERYCVGTVNEIRDDQP